MYVLTITAIAVAGACVAAELRAIVRGRSTRTTRTLALIAISASILALCASLATSAGAAPGDPIGPPVEICSTPDGGPTTCTPGQWYEGPLPWRTDPPPATPVDASPRFTG